MVVGLDVFRDHFSGFSDRYVLIGGTAAYLLLDEADLQPRATRDLDIVLCVEALDADFVRAFWDFVEAGGYQNRQRSTGRKVFYRFTHPADESYPVMLELFSRRLDELVLGDDSALTPIPVSEEVASLSAILLDDEYYDFLHAHKLEIEGLSLAGETSLIPLKASAWLDLTKRRADGERIDSRDIKKHRSDIFRLYQLLSPRERIALPATIADDLSRFLDAMEHEVDTQLLTNLGIRGVDVSEVSGTLREVYQLGDFL